MWPNAQVDLELERKKVAKIERQCYHESVNAKVEVELERKKTTQMERDRDCEQAWLFDFMNQHANDNNGSPSFAPWNGA